MSQSRNTTRTNVNSSSRSALPILTLEKVLLGAVVLIFVVQAINILRVGAPLGHDESVYSLRSRDFVRGGEAGFYWSAYRAPGLPMVLVPLQFVGPSESLLRGVVALFAVVLILSTWWLGRTMFGRRAGLIAAGGVAVAPTIVGSGTQVWPDVPGAALGMVALAYYAWHLHRERLSVRTVTVVSVLVALATLMRFGAPIALGLGLMGLTLWRWEIATRYWRQVASIALASGIIVAAILLVPATTGWAQGSLRSTTAPLTAVRALAESKDLPWTTGFEDFWKWRDLITGGSLTQAVAAFGLFAGIVAVVQKKIERRAFIVAFGTAAAIACAIGVLLQGEARYLSPAFSWIWIAIGAGLGFLSREWNRRASIAIGAFAMVAALVTAINLATLSTDFNQANYQHLETAARAIDDASVDHECAVLTSYTPQIGWYSKCTTFAFNVREVRIDHPALPSGDRFMVLVEKGKRQPTDDLLDEYLDQVAESMFTLEYPIRDGTRKVDVYRLPNL